MMKKESKMKKCKKIISELKLQLEDQMSLNNLLNRQKEGFKVHPQNKKAFKTFEKSV
jgi:hypothetical protein